MLKINVNNVMISLKEAAFSEIKRHILERRGGGILSNVNHIQSKIMELEGGAFQDLFDAYLHKKYNFKNIQTLGIGTGTNKPTKGTPDSFVRTDDGKYILINYGSVKSQPAKKIQSDIMSCFDKAKLSLPKDKIKKIICGHCSTNIHIEQYDSIVESIEGVEIELIGIDTLSHDLAIIYPHIAKDKLGIAIDTNQFFDVEDFVKAYDANGINAPINCEFFHRESEIIEACKSINDNTVTILTGPSGIGKTRLALELCRKQEGRTIKVFCIKSNGNLLYEDIRFYITDPGNYLLFFDDANMVTSLDNVLHTILTYSEDYEIKVLITVRDYAKERVINTVLKYSKPNVIEIGRFKDDEIKDILNNNLGIVNENYLKKITEIANGNIRLAFLAGIRSIDDGYQAICNAEDIFKNYYGRVIDDAKLTKNDILMLFFITVAGPVKGNENRLYNDLKKLYGKEIDEINTVEKLYYLELIDWFKNEITKISDQSLGNYITYYVLVEKKWIDAKNIIAIGFPRYRNKVIYVLNTLVALFKSEELSRYIEDSIISAWSNAPIEQEMDYLESFYQIDPDKALSIIMKHIRQEKTVAFDLHSFDISSKKNYHRISTNEIEILGGFKYTDYFEDAVDLLIMYFAKRPDLIMDFYFVISDQMLYDRYSWKSNYSYEMRLMDKLWSSTEEGNNYNNSMLYLHIAACALKTEISFTEAGRNSRSFSFVRMRLGFAEEIAAIRTCIWKNLAILRKKEEYKSLVNRVLSKVHLSGLSEEDVRKYLKSDFDIIYEYIIDKDKPDFFDAKIVAEYEEKAKKNGLTMDDRFMISKRNLEFRIYRMLTHEQLIDGTLEDDEKIRREFLAKEITSYKLVDYRRMFAACCFLENTVHKSDLWAICTGLDCIFEILEDNTDFYVDVITEYFNENAPFSLNGYHQIKYLIDHIGYDATLALVSGKEFDKKNTWLSLIWECIPEEIINEKIVNDYKGFVLSNLVGGNPVVPTVKMISLYGERDSELKAKVIESIIDCPNISAAFIDRAYHDDDIEVILHVFRDNMEDLACIYMNAIKHRRYVDYGGKLFIKIFEQRPVIWNEYVDWVKDNIYRDDFQNGIFELIWKVEEWDECVDYAFKILIEEGMESQLEETAKVLFAKSSNDNVLIKKIKQWLLDKLHKRCTDIVKCRNLINVVVTVFPEWKMEFILEFLKENKKVEDFKELYLFPLSYSWSGSEIPQILEKIDFLKSLKDRLKGVDYIDHRKYLEERWRSLEQYQVTVELKEYLENADYA